MKRTKTISLLLIIFILIALLPMNALAAGNDKTTRTVYLHAQGENPQLTTNNSTVYMLLLMIRTEVRMKTTRTQSHNTT